MCTLQVSKEAKLDIDEEDYVAKFVPAMMDVVNAWCKGHTFAQICKVCRSFFTYPFCKIGNQYLALFECKKNYHPIGNPLTP